MIDPQHVETFRPFVTSEAQHAILDVMKTHGNISSVKIGRILGKADDSVRRSIRRLKQSAAKYDVDPERGRDGDSVPAGFMLNKSTVHIKDGSLIQRWDRVEQDRQDAFDAAVKAISDAAEGIRPSPAIPKPRSAKKGLLGLYTMADVHIGLYAWAREAGESYSTDEAQKIVWKCFSEMIDRMPDCESAVLNLLGDFLHYDGLVSETPEHGNILDTDSRYQKLAEIATNCLLWMVEALLKKHQKLHIIIVEGNHDPVGSAWMRVLLKHMFAKNKRITLDDSPSPYNAYLHGQTMLAFHHGHKTKDKELGALFAADGRFREMWGNAKQTYIHTGHLHSQSVQELSGAIVERHPTLAARSAYAHRGGWVSHRAAKAICYDDQGNEYMRVSVNP